MHIEFNAGGFGGFNIAVFQERTWRFEQSVDTVKNGFDNVKNSIYNMNGGVGNLEEAVELINKRKEKEEDKKENIHRARQKTANYLVSVLNTDREVEREVAQNAIEHYNKYPELYLQKPGEKNWLDRAKDFVGGLFSGGKKLIEKGTEFLKKLGEKGAEYLHKIIGLGEKAVKWLVEQGKNLYEAAGKVLDFLGDVFDKFVELGGKLWNAVFDFIADRIEDVFNFVGDLFDGVIRTIGEVIEFIQNFDLGEFLQNHLGDLIDLVGGVIDVAIGVVSIVIAAGEIASGGLAPVGILQIIGGSISIAKGKEKILKSFWNIIGHEPNDAEKIYFTPIDTFENFANDLIPGVPLGDILGLTGDVIGMTAGGLDLGDALKAGTVITKVSKIGSALSSVLSFGIDLKAVLTPDKSDDKEADWLSRLLNIGGLVFDKLAK